MIPTEPPAPAEGYPSQPSAAPSPANKPGDPYCSNCRYPLAGLTEESRCPECGLPLVDVLARMPGTRAYRYRSGATLFGWPLIDIALGPRPEFGEQRGRARGIIAIGDVAFGGIAVGGLSVGVVSIGGGAIGIASLGGGAIGLLTAIGGGAIGGFCVGGGAAGAVATGGAAAGVIAQGGGGIAYYGRGPGMLGAHIINNARQDPEAVRVFHALEPLLGSVTSASGPGRNSVSPQPLLVIVSVDLVLAMLVALFAAAAHLRYRQREADRARGLRA